jgi:hypothetical protein
LHSTGLGLLELLAVSAAGALLAVGTYSIYRRASDAHAVERERSDVAAITENVVRIYSGRNAFGGLSNDTAVAFGAFPPTLIPAQTSSGGAITNTWGGAISVQATNADGDVNANGFTIAYSNVPARVCASFVSAAGNGFYETTVQPQSLPQFGAGFHTGSVLSASDRSKVDPALAATRCALAEEIRVAFTYRSNPLPRTSCAGSGPISPNYDTQTAVCPPGTTNSLSQLVSDPGPDQYQSTWQQTHSQDGSCGPSGTIVWGPWTPWDPPHTCADQCIPVNTTTHNSRSASCPAGTLVSAPGPYLY